MSIVKLDRTARRLKLPAVSSLTLCILLSFIVLTIHYFFDAAAYDLYLPMTAGICTALLVTTKPLIAEALAREGKLGDQTDRPPNGYPAAFASHGTTFQSSSERRNMTNSAPIKHERNPFRIGRRRNPSERKTKHTTTAK